MMSWWTAALASVPPTPAHASLPPTPLASVPPKRGFVADTRNGTCADAQLLSAGTSWYYDYNVGDPCKPRHSPATSRRPASPRLSALQLARLRPLR